MGDVGNCDESDKCIHRDRKEEQGAGHIEEKFKIGEQKKILASEREKLRTAQNYPNDIYLDKHVFYVRVEAKTFQYNILDPSNVANFENKRILSMSYMTFLFDKLVKSFKTSMSLSYTDENIVVSANYIPIIYRSFNKYR